MSLGREAQLAVLRDRACAEAGQAGHAVATPLHLIVVLGRLDPGRLEREFPAALRNRFAEQLAALPHHPGAARPSPELDVLLNVAAVDAGPPVDVLWKRLRQWLAADAAPPDPGTSDAGPSDDGPSDDGEDALDDASDERSQGTAHDEGGEQHGRPAAAVPRRLRSALQTLVRLQLVRALEAATGERLLARVLAGAGGDDALRLLAAYLRTGAPVIAIEAELPYVEEVVLRVLAECDADLADFSHLRPVVAFEGSETLRLDRRFPPRALVLLPQHARQPILEFPRVCQDLATQDVGVLIGCRRLAELPDALRSLVDIRLVLPGIDPALFSDWFAALCEAPLPAGAMEGGENWVPHVEYTDFEQPQRLGLPPAEVLAYVREAVQARIRAVEVANAKSLAELHGLGEALQFSRDLIAEIHLALRGALPWDSVDRGVLLAGPPGTGKTTLARAIAKECGVRFLAESVGRWQEAGHLGDHIRAIRASFAEARRYAPSILFIDEIDGLGNREHLSGANAQYQTEVINAVLEQMQGLDAAAPVFVIAATNHPERIDPALRRAGRLDRVIQIPYPNSEALAALFRDALARQPVAQVPAPGAVDLVLLSRLAVGLTGADVEQMVRGAARRARRSARAVATEDVIAEITHRPRDAASAPRMGPEEQERVAVHESGHAVMRYLESDQGRDIAFVSIVPRTDGTLGFVAVARPERFLESRRECLGLLAVLMGGRAAEELRYGADGVSGGCANDLAVATQIALQMITRAGMGPSRRLASVEKPEPEHWREAEALLASVYDATLARLRAQHATVARLAAELLRRQEMSAEEVRAVLAGTAATAS